MMTKRYALTTLAVAASLAISARAQAPQPQQPPVFRSSTRLIVNTVVVRDRDGNVIEGLTAKDFIVTEDGKPQEIAFVEYQKLDAAAIAAAPAATLVAPTPAAPDGAPAPPPPPPVASVLQDTIAPPAPGDIKYRNRRLMIL